MIKVGENPEHAKGINKFLSKGCEGQRGIILAINKNGKEAIILSMNGSLKGDVVWGGIYHVAELSDEGGYPIVVKPVEKVPNNGDWHITVVK